MTSPDGTQTATKASSTVMNGATSFSIAQA